MKEVSIMIIAIMLGIIVLFVTAQNIDIGWNGRETGQLIVEGIVVDIEYYEAFGGTFTDWTHIIEFDDGSRYWIDTDNDLSGVRLNVYGVYYLQKDYFKYDGAWYKFHDLDGVSYPDV